MKFISTVALLALIVVSANAFARIRHLRDTDTEQWQKQIDQFVSASTSSEDLKEKVSEYYSKLTEKQSDFVKFYQKQCTTWIKSVASDEEKAELKALYQNKDADVLAGKINDYVNRLSENERAPVLLWKNACAYLWNIDIPVETIGASARVRRSTTSQNVLSTEWLTDDQNAQLSGLENDEYDKKYLSFFKELSGETKNSASKKIVKKCYAWLEDVASQEERDELKTLHHSDHSKCKEKVQEYLEKLPETKKTEIKEHLDVCEEIWYAEHDGHEHGHAHHHRRRRHHEHSFEDFAKEHLGWLTDDQKAEAMKLKDDKAALKLKMKEFFEATAGEKRQEAISSMKGACRQLLKHVLGDEKAAELKTMKESGASSESLKTKFEEYMNGITDEHLKEEANDHKEECMKMLMTPARKRRDHHHGHKLEDYLKTHLSWLTTEQGETLKTMKADGKTPSEMQKKVFEFYESTTGETRTKATELLKGGCRDLIKSVVGDEKAEELKKLKESGASDAAVSDKIKSYISEVEDPHKKELAVSYEGACKKVFGVASRMRREHDHGEHKLEDYFKSHFSWLTEDQKDELRQMKTDGKKAPELYNKALQYYESATGEVKEKAKELMQGGCRELIRVIVGNEKADQLTAMKESGTSVKDIDAKLQEFVGEITDEGKKTLANTYGPGCRKLFGIDSRKRRDNHHGHKLEDYLKTHLSWLTTEQGETLKTMKADGKTPSEMQKKVFEFYESTTGETRTKATELLKGGCRDLIKSVVGDEKAEELKKLKESGASDAAVSDKIKSYISEVEDPHKKELAVSYEGACKKVFGVASRKRRDHHHGHKLEDYLKTHLSWLTTEQAETLKQMKVDNKSPDEMQKKVFEFYDATTGETRAKATELLQGGCRDLMQTIIGQEKAAELKTMKESGASIDEINAKVKEFVGQVDDEEKKQLASKYEGACKKVFGVQSRKRRDHYHDDDEDLEKFAENHLTWLTDEQKQEVTALKDSGKDAIKAKIHEFYNAATGETKAKATLELQNACQELINKVIGEEHAAILKGLRESGADIGEIQKKVDEFLAQVPDEKKRKLAEDHREGCAQMFLTPPSRRLRRDKHHEHTLKEFVDNHLTWLNGEQKAQILELDGQKEAIKAKINEFFEKTSGDEREKATASFQAACRERLVHVLGDQKAAELKTMRESGASNEALMKKTEELLATVEDETLRKEADEHKEDCLKVFGIKSRKIRDCGFDTAKHLTWLTDEQEDILNQMKAEKKAPKDIHKKIFEFYDATTGETRTKATELMQGGCRDVLKHVLGEEKTAELKALKESGASNDEMSEKIKDMMSEIDDKEKKSYAVAYEGPCKRIFGVGSRKRRDHHHGHKLEDYLKTHLSWLTTEQGETLKTMKADGKTPSEMQKKVFEFYESTTGETRTKATELLKGGCRDLIKSVVGDEKAEELKKLKESGASDAAVSDKIKSYISEVEDPHKKELAVSYEGACKKVFGVESRKKRHEGTHGIDDFVNNHLSWLNTEQKTEIDKLKVEGNFAGIKARVNTFFEAATGETKVKATEELKGACRELYHDILGEKAAEVKVLKESGATDSELAKKIDELIAGVTDEAKKAKAEEYKADCKKIYGVQSRKRRTHDHGDHDLEDYFKNHYSWLNDEQKDELRQMKKDGKKEEIWNKALEFYEATTGETKEKAKELMQGGCRELIRVIVGNEKADQLTSMKESGTSVKDLDAKLQEFVGEVTEEYKKGLAKTYGPGCRKIFGVASRMRREHDHGEHKLEDYFKSHFSWLTEDQKDELRQMKTDGKKAPELYNKALQYYESATGEVKEKAKELMQGGCRELIRVIVGNEKADQLTAMKESGTSVKDIDAKLQEFVGEITDEGKKTLANTYGPGCRKLFGVDSRKRRSHDHGDHDLEDYFKNHYSWLSDEQKEELRQMKKDGKKDDIWSKSLEFYEATTGETKEKAKELMQGGCRELIRVIVGNEKADEIATLKQSGATLKDMDAKLQEFLADVTDEGKKKLAKTYGPGCRKVFGVASRMRREHDHGEHKLEDYFKSHFSWLTEEQKDELRQMKTDGKKAPELYNKALQYYESATGEVKEKAKELMQGGCRELIRVIVGNEKADQLTSMKESGTSVKDIDAKLQEFVGEITDEGKKTLANTYGPGCRKLFGVAPEKGDAKRKRRAFHPTVTHLDFIRAVVGNEDKPEPSHRALTYQIMDIYDAEKLSERARNVVNQCHGLFGEIVELSPYKNENSLRELLHLLRSASDRQLKGIQAVAEVCKKTVQELEETEGNHGSIGKTLIEMFKNLDDEPRSRLREQWKSKCLDWILDVTDAEERDDLKYLLRMGRVEVLQERVTELMSRFDDKTRTQVGHMRPVCENLLGFVHNSRKTFHRKVPVETVF